MSRVRNEALSQSRTLLLSLSGFDASLPWLAAGFLAELMTRECSGGTQGLRSAPSNLGTESDKYMAPPSVLLQQGMPGMR